MATIKTIYQTSFCIDSKNEESALFGIQKIIYNWIVEKEQCSISIKGESNFFRKIEITNSKTQSTVNTRFLLDDKFFVWGCEYCEFPKKISGKILTEIILKELNSTKTVIAYVNITLRETSSSTTDWKPSIPRFIRRIVSSDNFDVYSGHKDFKVGYKPITVRCGEGKTLRDWIDSPCRKYPIFVFNNSSDKKVSDAADKIAKMLIGKAQVFLLDNDPELVEELSVVANKALYFIRVGYFKLFYPKYGTFIRTDYINIYEETYGDLIYNITKFILRDFTIYETGAVPSFKQIIEAIRISQLLRKNKESSNYDKSYIETLITDNESLKNERDKIQSEINQISKCWEEEANLCDSLKVELANAKVRIDTLSRQIGTKDDKRLVSFRKKGIPSTLSLNDICVLFEILYSDRIIIPQFVKDSLTECKFNDLQIFWEMLSSLTISLYEMKFINNPSKLNKLDRIGRFEYTATEGKMTNRDKELLDLRKVEIGSKTYDISPHIKYGNKPPKCIRIHFAFDDDSQKIIIGFIGAHMPNYIGKTR